MNDRDFWLEMRRGLLKQVEAIEKMHLPDKYEERQAAHKYLEDTRRKRVELPQT